jgi:hypothetical protein
MDVRETLRRRPLLVGALSTVCIGLVAWTWFVNASDERGDQRPATRKSWYTIDDGRHWFADAMNKIVPFEHEGKQAYRCFVWTCDGGTTEFVSHLERLYPRRTPATRRKRESPAVGVASRQPGSEDGAERRQRVDQRQPAGRRDDSNATLSGR